MLGEPQNNNKILGWIDSVIIGDVEGKGACMSIDVNTYLHGAATFQFPLDKAKEIIEKYHIPDITLLYDAPVVLIKNENNFKFHEICKTRRI